MNTYYLQPGYEPRKTLLGNGDAAATKMQEEFVQASVNYQLDVYKLARSLLMANGYKTILDVSFAPPIKLKRLLSVYASEITVVGLSNSEEAAKAIVPEAMHVSTDFESIGDFHLGKTFDLIVVADLLEHLNNADGAMRFLYRHLSRNGRILFATPECGTVQSADLPQRSGFGFIQKWNKSEFRSYVSQHRFNIESHVCLPLMKTNIWSQNYDQPERASRLAQGCQAIIASRVSGI